MNRALRRARPSECGMTLMEVLVSAGVVAVCIPALLGAMLFAFGVLKVNAHKITALNLARKKIENVMNIQYSSISTTASAYNENNVALDSATGKPLATITVVVTNPSGTTRKNIAVTVRWAEQKRAHSVSLNTIVSKNNVT